MSVAGGLAPLRDRAARVTWAVVAGVFAVLAAWELPQQLGAIPIGADLDFYRGVGRTWVDSGQYYLPEQLAGRYEVHLLGSGFTPDVLYPPIALYLFVPFAFLPALLWWLIPAVILGYALWRWRPSLWAWAFIAFAAFWPRTQGAIAYGNSDLWVVAGVTAALLWHWPAVLVLFKPTFAPLVLAGYDGRRWWMGWPLLAGLSLPLLALWIDYARVVPNGGLPLSYSIGDLPLVLVPVAAYLARSNRPEPTTA